MTGSPPLPTQPVLETARLVLRAFVPADAPAVEAHVRMREIAEMTLTIPHPYPPGAATEWIESHRGIWESGAGATFGIVERETDAVVGAIGIAVTPEHARAEIGYWMGMAYWNRGYMTEAAGAVLTFGFRTLGLHRIQARHVTRNPASGRVMQKLGMRYEGVLRESIRKWGRFEDLAIYAVLVHEWDG